jgi:hypothetical protein
MMFLILGNTERERVFPQTAHSILHAKDVAKPSASNINDFLRRATVFLLSH